MVAIIFGVVATAMMLDRILRNTALLDFETVKTSATLLRPAELAYLAKPDDFLHTLLVIATDLTQRAVKATLSGEVPVILDYETKMWGLTKDFLKQATERKIEPYKPENFSLSPIRYFKRLSALYGTVTNVVRKLSKDVAKDPRHIRRYFSISGLIRLITDFLTDGYQDALRMALTTQLTEKRLLVSTAKCRRFSNIFISTGIGFALLSISATLHFLPPNLMIAIPLLAILCALVVQLTIFLRDLIPLYPELAELLGHLERKNWRISAIRAVLYLLRVFSWAIAIGAFMFMIDISTAFLLLVFHGLPLEYVFMLVTLAGLLLACFSLVAYGLSLKQEQVATSLGKRRLNEARRRINKVSPIAAGWEMLRSESYDPQFSEIVAIYGIAPLIILA